MPTFGAYETVTEISRGAICTLWTGRKSAGSAAGTESQVGATVYAIKVCQPDVDISGVEQAQASVQAFLEQVDAQRRLAGLPNSVWGPIHDSGRADASGVGAYYVTDYFARTSLERFVTSRARPDPKVLQAVVAGALGGIRQIRDFLHRPHGNLHAGNVLLITSPEGSRIVLTDPAAQSQLKGRTDVAGDLKALGAILYQLVTHQEHHERSGWPVADSADWKRVPGGDKWRALCNRLLDPNPGSPPTVEEIEQTLLNLTAKGGKGAKKAVLIGAGAALAAVVGVGAYMALKPEPPPVVLPPVPPSEQWVRLVEEYEEWFAAFSTDLTRTKAKGLEDRIPEFKTWRTSFESLAKDNPWEIAGVVRLRVSLDQLKKEAPAAITQPEAVKAATDLLGLITTIKGAITTKDWTLAKEAAGITKTWREQAWEAPAAEIDKALAGVEANGSMIQTASTLAVLLDKAKQIEAARAIAWTEAAVVAEASKKIGGDKVLDGFKGWASAYPARKVAGAAAGAMFDALASSLEDVRRTAKAVGDFLATEKAANVCFDELAKDAFYAKFKLDEAAPDDFGEWITVANSSAYANPSAKDDPRPGAQLAVRIPRLSEEFARLKENGVEPGAESLVALGELAAALRIPAFPAGDDVSAKLAAIGERVKRLEGLKWDCRTKEEITGADYLTAGSSIQKAVSDWAQLNQIAAVSDSEALATLAKGPLVDSSAIKEWWTAHQEAVFSEPNLRTRRQKATDLHGRLAALDQGVPRWKPPQAPGGGRQPEWMTKVAAAANDEREAMIRKFLARYDPASSWAGEQGALGDQFKERAASLDKIVAAATAAERLMNAGYGLDEAASGAKSVRTLAAEAFGETSAATVAMEQVASRVTALKEVADETDPAALTRRITLEAVDRPELILAAWHGLGRVGEWPATAADLENEAGAFRHVVNGALRTIQTAEGSTTRSGELDAAIKQQRRARWESFVKRARAEESLKTAMTAHEPMDVDLKQIADPLAGYRVRLYQLKQAISAAGASDDEVRAKAAQFVREVPPTLADRAKSLVTELNAAIGEDAAPVRADPTKFGPGLIAGWTGQETPAPGGGSRLQFTNGQLSLVFLRVEAGQGVPDPVYLGVDEVTVGEYIQIVDGGAGAAGWRTVKELMPDVETVMEGPRAWRWADKLAPVGEWLQSNRSFVGTASGQAPAYAPAFLRPGSGGRQIIPERAPSLDSPLQYISPRAALYAAALVGCRFPTAAEWALASQSGAAEGTPNLRDQSWLTQRDHIIAARRLTGNTDQFPFPDYDVFMGVNAPEGEAATAGAGNDGWLWFEPASRSAAGFAHLTGNVAEFVLASVPEGPASASKSGVDDFLGRRGRDLAVIGGSALSPPQAPTDKPAPVTDDHGLWPDVGFRLAFTATGTTGAQLSKADVVLAIFKDGEKDPFLFK